MSKCDYSLNDVYGMARGLPNNYVSRESVDDTLDDSLHRDKHVVIYGSSKQGKTCLRKSCIDEDDQIVIQCGNDWSISDLHSSILKRAGYQVTLSEQMTVSGVQKITAKVRSGIFSGGSETTVSGSKSTEKAELELDPTDVNDVIRALEKIEFDRYIVLEDFHYLSEECQKDFAVSLKAFHEASPHSFVVVGVWLEENRLIVHNGDLTGRVIAVNADIWTKPQLIEVIEKGEKLLNIKFDDGFKDTLTANCFDSVFIVQEACREVCKQEGITSTQSGNTEIGESTDAKAIVSRVVNDQSARYESFLRKFSDGFQKTELEMYRWLLYPIITSDIENLEDGLRYGDIRSQIQDQHPVGEDLNPGNLTQALKSTASLQVKTDIKPIILDYDQTSKRLSVVDRGFLIWLANQNKNALLEQTGLDTHID